MKILKIPSSKRVTASKQEVLIQALEGIGDILVFETKRQKNKIVLEGLKKISDTVKKIFEIQKNDPDKFERLVISQDFFELYEKDKEEAGLRMAFDPERYLISFSTAINQIVRVYSAAINSQNGEISQFAVYHINWILAELSSRPNNALFIEQLLRQLSEIMRTAVQRNDGSAYAATTHWYTDIVFNRLSRQGKFQLAYLKLFDKYFFSTVRYIVAKRQTAIFKSLISTLVDGIHIPDYDQGEIWNYGHILLHSDLQKFNQLDEEHGLEKKVKELADAESDLDTQEKLDAWLQKFDEVKKIVAPSFNEDQAQSALKIEKKIRNYIHSQFKHQNLLDIVFAICAYCLFKQRYDYVKYLWEYKQPPDSDASWAGHDITPKTLDEAITFYFRKGLFERRLDFWEGHHGSEKYYKHYFLLLIARLLQNVPKNVQGEYLQVINYQLPDLHIHRLSDLEHSVDDLTSLAVNLRQSGSVLAGIGLDTERLDETFDEKLIPFLARLKEEAKKQITAKHRTGHISINRVKEFKKEVLNSFYDRASVRDIFTKHLNGYENKMHEQTQRKDRFGINIVDDKASFFDEWYIHYVGWGENYGHDIASAENSYLLDALAKECEVITKNDFEVTLARFENRDDIAIFATNVALWHFFEHSKKFKPKWHRGIEALEIKGFEGWYEYNDQAIPVFGTHHRKVEKQILILNKSRIGKLVQLSPISEGEDEASVEDIFYVSVQAFSESEQLMEEFINKPPEWLSKVGDEQEQRNHLQERVRIRIVERFEYIKPDDFEGYKLLLNED